tara:strand:+ start:1931 stop:2500 length:570 start_codon:yes stop_codon:yes gene_type:complete
MKSVTFKESGPLYFLQKIMFKKNAPDTCSYKRELIISAIVFLVTLHASILRLLFWAFPKNRHDSDTYGFKSQVVSLCFSLVFVFIGYAIVEDFPIVDDFIHWHELSLLGIYLNTFVVMGIGAITFAIAGGIIVGICFIVFTLFEIISNGFNSIRDMTPPLTNDEGEPRTQIGLIYKSAKERWCKKIDWE